MNQFLITEDGVAELDKYFIEHKDALFRIAWKNFKDKHISNYHYKDSALDITGADGVQVQIKDDGKVLWVNTENGCVLRICQIKYIEVNDEREKHG
jgi:hypothetical protein